MKLPIVHSGELLEYLSELKVKINSQQQVSVKYSKTRSSVTAMLKASMLDKPAIARITN